MKLEDLFEYQKVNISDFNIHDVEKEKLLTYASSKIGKDYFILSYIKTSTNVPSVKLITRGMDYNNNHSMVLSIEKSPKILITGEILISPDKLDVLIRLIKKNYNVLLNFYNNKYDSDYYDDDFFQDLVGFDI